MPNSLPVTSLPVTSLSATGLPAARGLLDFAAFAGTPVATDPFPHLLIRRFVPPASLADVIASLPEIEGGGSYPPSALRLRGAAAALVHELEGPRLRDAVAERFGLDLGGSRTMLTLRGRTREKDGRIHTDSTAKLVTVLLYLNPAGAAWSRQEGCLRLLRGPDDLDDYAVEVPPGGGTQRVLPNRPPAVEGPPVDGTLLVFPNGPTAFHGHKPFVGRRIAIQLNYMADGAKARHELRRHRLSALTKRLLPA